MKLRNPQSRTNLDIPSNAIVLDVGSGHNPHPRANVVVDKYSGDSNHHRASDLKVLKNQRYIEADGEKLPFGDKEFDYVICSHVLEHVDNPSKFLEELNRVGKAGYLECPSLIGEFLIPKNSHRWVILEIDNKLVIMDKEKIGLRNSHDFGTLFLDFLPRNSMGYKILQKTHHQVFTVNYEWKDSIEYIIDPHDDKLKEYFSNTWDKEMCEKMLPKRSLLNESSEVLGATYSILKSVIKSRMLGGRKS